MLFIYLIIISLPLYLVRFSILGVNTNILDLLLFLFIFFELIKYFYFKKYDLKKILTGISPNIKKILLPTALIFIGLVASTFKSEHIFMSLGIIKSWFVLPVLFFIGAAGIVDSDDKKKKVLRVWFVSGFLVALISFLCRLAGFVTYDGRLSALFSSPNNLAMFLAPSFIIGIFMLVDGHAYRQADKRQTAMNNARKGIFWSIAAVFIGIIIFLTKSLGGALAIVIALLPIFYRQIKNSKNKIAPSLILALLVLSIIFLASGKDFGDRSSLISRIMIWKSSGRILKDNFILGIGPGMFQKKYLSYQKYFTPYLEWAVPHPHNIFLAFWLQSGLIGLVGFIWLIVIFFKNILVNKYNKIILLCGALMIYFLVHGLVDDTYWRNDLAIMFWMTILLSLNYKTQIAESK